MASNSLKKLYKKNKKYLADTLNLNYLLDKFYLDRQNEESTRRFGYFHPSFVSKGIHCSRWWYYFLQGEPGNSKAEAFSVEMLANMDIGTAIHNQMHKNLYNMGILEGVWRCICCGHEFWATSPKACPNCLTSLDEDKVKFMEIPLDNGFIRGHADGILNLNPKRYLLEMKSIKNVTRPKASYGFEVLHSTPIDDHELQTNLYMYLWNEKAEELSAYDGQLIIVDQEGNLGRYVDDSPVATGVRLIGKLDMACVLYLAKNNADRKLYVIRYDEKKIRYLVNQMKTVWGYYIQGNIDACTIQCNEDPMMYENRAQCRYRYLCFPEG